MKSNSEIDWRARSRVEIGSTTRYRVAGREQFEHGELGDLSAIGALIWTEEEIAIGTEISFLVESADPDEAPIEFVATVVRVTPEKNERMMFGYGCQITETKNSEEP